MYNIKNFTEVFMIKRVSLFLLTNIAVLLVISFFAKILGVDRILDENGLNLGSLLLFSLIVGFSGSLISLFLSKQMAKTSMGAKVIES
ncbi:MAG: hypothetical protein GX170_01595, partial [Campylobacteraceae bacterium]|nr:hypothetical protein [Campylobacteraceae bacterium]